MKNRTGLKLGVIFGIATALMSGCGYNVDETIGHFVAQAQRCSGMGESQLTKINNILANAIAKTDIGGGGRIGFVDLTQFESAGAYDVEKRAADNIGVMKREGVKICLADQVANKVEYNFATRTLNVANSLPEDKAATELAKYVIQRNKEFWTLSPG